jgi:hypothetical protein
MAVLMLSLLKFQGVAAMSETNEIIDLSPLPVSARQEVRDFYEFLLARRGQVKGKKFSSSLPPAFDTPIKVREYLNVSRGEIYDEV